MNYLKKLIELVMKFFRGYSPQSKETNEMEYMLYQPLTDDLAKEIKDKLMETNTEKFIKICLGALDTDPSTPDGVKDELACSETMTILIKRLFPDFPIIFSTKDLDFKLFTDKRFERITEPSKGSIIISPRTDTTFGHVGMFITSERIASNDSRNGLFQGNYIWSSWINEFKTKRGLKIYIYKLKD